MADTVLTYDEAHKRALALWRQVNQRPDLAGRDGWEPPNPYSETITALVHHGYLRRADGRCGFERFKDSYVIWTDAGRRALTQEITDDQT